MDILYPDQGLVYLLKYGISQGVNMHLRTSPALVSLSDTLGEYTECSITSAQSVTSGAWTQSGVQAHQAFIQAPLLTFLPTSGSATVAGWYMTDVNNSMLLETANYDTPILLTTTNGAQVPCLVGSFSELSN